MGSAQSINKNCCYSAKGRNLIKTNSFLDISESSREILLYKEDFQNQGLSILDNKGEITHVRFGSEENEHWVLTDEDLFQLRELKNLTSIDLTNCGQITRRGLQSFSLNPGQIKSLILTDCPKITDRFCDHIVHYSSLERLDIRGCFRISDNGIGAFTSLRYLKHLDLSVGATLSSEGNNQSISDVSMHTLAQMPQLVSLQLEGCASITDKGLIRLAALRNLTFLNLSSTGITDASLSIIHQLPKLCILEIGSCHFTQPALLGLAQNKNLTRLNLANVPGVTDRVMEALSKSLDLHHLDVSGCHSLTDHCLKHICRFRNLVKLTANRCTGLSECKLGDLSRLTSLTSLRMDDVVVKDLNVLTAMTELRHLEIAARSVTEDDLSKLSGLVHLTDLTIHLTNGDVTHRCLNIEGIRVKLIRRATNDNF